MEKYEQLFDPTTNSRFTKNYYFNYRRPSYSTVKNLRLRQTDPDLKPLGSRYESPRNQAIPLKLTAKSKKPNPLNFIFEFKKEERATKYINNQSPNSNSYCDPNNVLLRSLAHNSNKAPVLTRKARDMERIELAQNIRLVSSQLGSNWRDSTNISLFGPSKNFDHSQCPCAKINNRTCLSALKWLRKFYPSEGDLVQAEERYSRAVMNIALAPEDRIQIEKDLPRTYPEILFIRPDSPGGKQLRNILFVFSTTDLEVGYVQGMNFIAAGLLYHSSESHGFWLMMKLFELLDLRDVYRQGLPGLEKHIKAIYSILKRRDPILVESLEEAGLIPELYLTEWIISFGGYFIPIELTGLYYDGIFIYKWGFFYAVVLNYMRTIREEIIGKSEQQRMEAIKKHNLQNRDSVGTTEINWKEILNDSLAKPIYVA